MINAKAKIGNSLERTWILFDPNRFLGSGLLGIVSGVVGGLVMGVTARASMRAVALLAGSSPSFSVEGTLVVIGFGALFGAVAGLVYGFILPFLPGSMGQKGLAFGGILALLITLLIIVVRPEGELALVSKWALIALFASLPLIYGLIMGKVASRLVPADMKMASRNGRFAQVAAIITITAAIINGLIELTLILFRSTTLNLGYDMSVFLDNAAGGTLLVMAIAAVAGLLRSGATGKSAAAKIGLGLALLIFAFLGIGSISEGLSMIELHGLVRLMVLIKFDENLFVLLIFFLVGVLGLIVGGIAVLQARRWQRWRRYSLLVVGFFPLFALLFLHPDLLPAMLDISMPGRYHLAHGAGALFALCWLGLGLALRVETGPNRIEESGPAAK